MVMTILAAVVVLGVLILVHELGHFWAAKAVDVEVPRFSIGFGPKVFGFTRGETEYVISALPLGGYVKMAGMGEEEAFEKIEGGGEPDREPSPRDFDSKPAWARGLILSAGVGMNFLFAVVAFAAIAVVWGVAAPDPPVLATVQEEVLPASALELARVPSGSRIAAIRGSSVESWEDVTLALGGAPAGETTMSFADGTSVTFTIPSDDEGRRNLVTALLPPSGIDPVLGEIAEGSPADSAGLRPGDRVVSVEGSPVESWEAFAAAVERRPGRATAVTVMRDGERVALTVTPDERTLAAAGDTVRYGRVGVGQDRSAVQAALGESERQVGPIAGVAHGFERTWTWTVRVVEVVADLITGDVATENLAGPVRIAQMSGDVARAGPPARHGVMALLSGNQANLNLLPIPVLDGGQLLLLGVESLRGERVSVEARIRWAQLGLLLAGALMVWAIGNDLLQLFG